MSVSGARKARGRRAAAKAVAFYDLDGTLVSQELDFEAIRRDVGLPSGTPLLEALERMSELDRERAWRILHDHEQSAAARATLFPGVTEVLDWLDGRGLRRGLLSRNSRRSVQSSSDLQRDRGAPRCSRNLFSPGYHRQRWTGRR